MYIVQPGSATSKSNGCSTISPPSNRAATISPPSTIAALRWPGIGSVTRTATSTTPSPATAVAGTGVLTPSPRI